QRRARRRARVHRAVAQESRSLGGASSRVLRLSVMQTYWPFVAVLVALLAGLAAGKAWERYKLVEGHWIDRRRVRQSPHFILGLNYLVAGQVDPAVHELVTASSVDPAALELRLVL